MRYGHAPLDGAWQGGEPLWPLPVGRSGMHGGRDVLGGKREEKDLKALASIAHALVREVEEEVKLHSEWRRTLYKAAVRTTVDTMMVNGIYAG